MSGIDKLMEELQVNTKKLRNETKVKLYIALTYGLSIVFSVLIFLYIISTTKNIILSLLLGLTSYIPLIEIIMKIVNTILSKNVKPKIVPKMDFLNGIPKEYATFVVFPTVINSEKKVKALVRKLEVSYLANKSENIYFAVLGDCTTSQKQNELFDDTTEEFVRRFKKDIQNINNGNLSVNKFKLKVGKSNFNLFAQTANVCVTDTNIKQAPKLNSQNVISDSEYTDMLFPDKKIYNDFGKVMVDKMAETARKRSRFLERTREIAAIDIFSTGKMLESKLQNRQKDIHNDLTR